VVYFALVFGAGFVLGPIRILFLVSHVRCVVGLRVAELMEFPVMLVVIESGGEMVGSKVPTNSAAD
jgi:hypothetical protein